MIVSKTGDTRNGYERYEVFLLQQISIEMCKVIDLNDSFRSSGASEKYVGIQLRNMEDLY